MNPPSLLCRGQRWAIRYYVAPGVRKVVTTPAKTEAEAKDILRDWTNLVWPLRIADHNGTREWTLRHLCDWYLDAYMPGQRREPGTIRNSQNSVNALMAYCNGAGVALPSQFTPEHAAGWVGQMLQARHPNTVRRIIRDIRAMIHVGEDIHSIEWPISPRVWARLMPAEVEVPPQDLSVAEVQTFARAMAGSHLYAAVLFLLATGIRPCDLCHLRPIDVHGDRVEFVQQKTRRSLSKPLNALARYALAIRPRRDAAVLFAPVNSERYSANTLGNRLRDELARHDLPPGRFTLRALRHTFATWLGDMPGADIHVVSQQLGHAGLGATPRYRHIKTTGRSAIMEALGDEFVRHLGVDQGVDQPGSNAT